MDERFYFLIIISLLIIAMVLTFMSCCEGFCKIEKSVKFGVEESVAPGKEGDKEKGGGTTEKKGRGGGTENKKDGPDTETSLEIEKEHTDEKKGKDGSKEEKGKEHDITKKKESVNEAVEADIKLIPSPPLLPPFFPTHSSKPLQILPPTALRGHPKESINEDGGSFLTTKEKGREGTYGNLDGPDTFSSGEKEKDENDKKERSEKEKEFLENANDNENENVNEEVETIAELMPPPPSLLPPSLSTHSYKPLQVLPPTTPWRHPKESSNEDGGGLTIKEKEAAEGKIDGPDTYSSGEDGNGDEKENVNEEVETIAELMPPPPPLLPPFLSTHSLKPLRILLPTAPQHHPKESSNEDDGGLTTKEKEAAEGKVDGPNTYSSGEEDEKENANEKVETIVDLTPPAPTSSSRSSKLSRVIPPTAP